MASPPRAAPSPTSPKVSGRRVRKVAPAYSSAEATSQSRIDARRPLGEGEAGDVHHQRRSDGHHQHAEAHQDHHEQDSDVARAESVPEPVGHAEDLVDHGVQREDARRPRKEQADDRDRERRPTRGQRLVGIGDLGLVLRGHDVRDELIHVLRVADEQRVQDREPRDRQREQAHERVVRQERGQPAALIVGVLLEGRIRERDHAVAGLEPVDHPAGAQHPLLHGPGHPGVRGGRLTGRVVAVGVEPRLVERAVVGLRLLHWHRVRSGRLLRRAASRGAAAPRRCYPRPVSSAAAT